MSPIHFCLISLKRQQSIAAWQILDKNMPLRKGAESSTSLVEFLKLKEI